jgi:hypothetical protein
MNQSGLLGQPDFSGWIITENRDAGAETSGPV